MLELTAMGTHQHIQDMFIVEKGRLIKWVRIMERKSKRQI